MVTGVLAGPREEGRTHLTEIEAKRLVKEAGIPVVETELAASRAQAVSIARRMGFPIALKIVSPDISHKTDVGGVRLGLNSLSQVGAAYSDILAAVKQKQPSAKILGIAVQKMARPGVEVIIGMSKDPQFGPVLMFGLGGILVEVLKDVSFRIVPLARRDAAEMVQEIKGLPLLQGYRGSEPVKISVLEDILLKLSDFVEKHPEIKELDLNPIFAYSDGAVAVDARVVLEPE